MNQTRLIWIGKENRRQPEAELCERYIARIGHYARMDVKVIKAQQTGDLLSIQKKEGEKILSCVDPTDFLVLLDERGKHLTSEGLSTFITEKASVGSRRIVWLIGGAMGVSDSVRQRANFMLSLSKMTLPHALARVFLCEQIYRALNIRAGHPYHHEG